MRRFSCIRTSLCCALIALLGVSSFVSDARGQFSDERRDRTVAPGSSSNFFFEWQGGMSLRGLDLSLPDGWAVNSVEILRNGVERVGAHTSASEDPSVSYRVVLDKELKGTASIVVRAQTPAHLTVDDLVLVPLLRGTRGSEGVRDSGYAAVRRVRVERTPRSNANRALVMQTGDPIVMLRGDRLPDLGLEAPHTVEFWMKTATLDQLVLSTWDGDERSSYPIELEIGSNGRLRYYRGRPGEHQVMTTARPVADGAWHHVAIVHDPGPGWTRLYLDGVGQDSLFAPEVPRIRRPEAVVIGGRAGKRTSARAGFVGWIDELRFWDEPRSGPLVRRAMRRSLAGERDQLVFFSFESAIPDELLAQPVAPRRERSDLSFAHPIQEFRARAMGDEVVLTWETNDSETAAFIIERSIDGRQFAESGRLGPEARAAGSDSGSPYQYEFRERRADEQVVYYRIRQQMTDGSERVTASVKIGLGARTESSAVLIGNYPNPFNAHTTVTYRLEQSQRVRLSVWDVSGQPVAELVDAMQDAGIYEVQFDADDLPSGTYFVRMQTPSEIGWRTLTLMK